MMIFYLIFFIFHLLKKKKKIYTIFYIFFNKHTDICNDLKTIYIYIINIKKSIN